MPNPYGAPEISVHEVAQNRAIDHPFILMDVRELAELRLANLGGDVVVVPLSELASRREDALPEILEDKDQEIVVFCHTGVRSAQVTAWLLSLGWSDVRSMEGGIDAYARYIDPSVGTYR